MAIDHGYTTLPAALTHLGLPSASPESAQVESWIEAASRAIDAHCRRRIYAATETRVLSPTGGRLLTGDILSVSTLKTDDDGDRTYETTWSASFDYYLGPENAAVEGKPYWFIELDGNLGRYTWTRSRRSVQIAGVFGYSLTTPALVEQACLRLVARQYALKQAPLGVAGTGETGFIRIQVDRDVDEMLFDFKLIEVV